MRRHYLGEHRPIVFGRLLLSGRLYAHLAEIKQACVERRELLTGQLAKQSGVNEALKAAAQDDRGILCRGEEGDRGIPGARGLFHQERQPKPRHHGALGHEDRRSGGEKAPL